VKRLNFLVSAIALIACGHNPRTAAPEKHYALTGKIVSLNAERQTATVDAAAIPNFMEAMTMEYPVKSKSEFKSLQVGERITATVDVADDDSYSLSNVRQQAK
jgi:Cu/Ag efflux protein CusF